MDRKKTTTLASAMAALLVLTGAGEAGTDLQIPVDQYTLDNGLRVVLSENHGSPTVGVAVYYDVGSRNEVKGRSGFAHLFEHMMFQGSKNVGKAEHFQIINASGGMMNGTTSEDRTNYFESLPASMLPVALWLEADRMRSLAVTEENFENQRATVMEEKRENYDNQPYVPSFIEINALAYRGYWPYEHSTIGSMKDLASATASDAQAFFDLHYTPSNAVLAIAGDFDPAQARALVQEHFGDIVSHDPPGFSEPAWTPASEEVYDAMEDPLAPLPAFHMAYHVPPMRTPDFYPMTIISRALGDGESSRLEQELVKETGTVVEMYVDVDGRRGPDLLSFFCILSGVESPGQVRQRIKHHLVEIATKGLGQDEMERVKNRLRMAFYRMLDTNLRRALMLGRYKLYWDDPGAVNTELARYKAVTNEQIMEVASKYLVDENRIILDVMPPQMMGKEGGDE
jgi:predicted Zn-dependent peptidase